MKVNIPVGNSNFREIREKGYYYVDKTGLIKELVEPDLTEVTLITRPRRFGKTLGMSMLANFFDIRIDSRKLFQGLEILNEPLLCEKWMNQYPTLFLSLKEVEGLNFQSAKEMFAIRIAKLCNEHFYLATSDKVNENDRKAFLQLADMVDGNPSDALLKTSISIIMQMMEAHYQKPVILLIDEYDVPIAKANSRGYYDEMLDFMKGFMQALKDNTSLCFAVVTGCLKVAKESIFTGTNNFVSDTIVDSRLNEYFGFTDREVDKLLREADAMSYATDIKDWYDGYHFGNFDVYCPWDVMNYLRDLQYDSTQKPKSYWKNTSDNAIIRSFIDYAGNSITKKLEILLAGGCITQCIDTELTYDYLHSSEDNLWSILYLTGYLTTVRGSDLSNGEVALKIPNAEIKEIFETTVKIWFDDYAKTYDRKRLFQAVWDGDSETLTTEISTLLRMTISYHDYKEDFYHAFLAGIFTGAGYMVKSNREHGEGRSDVVIFDSHKGRVAIFEVKYSKSIDDMTKDCDRALMQINTKMYAKEFEDEYDICLCYGIAFYKKRCMVKKLL